MALELKLKTVLHQYTVVYIILQVKRSVKMQNILKLTGVGRWTKNEEDVNCGNMYSLLPSFVSLDYGYGRLAP